MLLLFKIIPFYCRLQILQEKSLLTMRIILYGFFLSNVSEIHMYVPDELIIYIEKLIISRDSNELKHRVRALHNKFFFYFSSAGCYIQHTRCMNMWYSRLTWEIWIQLLHWLWKYTLPILDGEKQVVKTKSELNSIYSFGAQYVCVQYEI